MPFFPPEPAVERDASVKPWDGGASAVAARAEDDLAETLSRIVADPARVETLHEVLGPFCHRSRNILNTLKISLYLAHRKEAQTGGSERLWEEVEERYRVVEEFYDRLQMLWRPLHLALVRLPLSLLLEDRRSAWAARFAQSERVLRMSAAGNDSAGDYDPNCLGLALDAFVAWRAVAGEPGGEGQLCWWTEQGRFELHWEEPPAHVQGPSSGAAAAARAAPLALPILGRVIAAHGGVMEQVVPGGRHVRLAWPQIAGRRGRP
jgi:hypothetical protein